MTMILIPVHFTSFFIEILKTIKNSRITLFLRGNVIYTGNLVIFMFISEEIHYVHCAFIYHPHTHTHLYTS